MLFKVLNPMQNGPDQWWIIGDVRAVAFIDPVTCYYDQPDPQKWSICCESPKTGAEYRIRPDRFFVPVDWFTRTSPPNLIDAAQVTLEFKDGHRETLLISTQFYVMDDGGKTIEGHVVAPKA